MEIIHSSGQAYELSPDTKIELTRTNPFFNEIGEQSLPVNIPASQRNTSLLGQPHRADRQQKIPASLDVSIRSGIFSLNARQVILSAQKNDEIQTSFYIRTGAFYEKIRDVTLVEIFKDKRIDFPNIDAAIDFVRSLITYSDSRFACFQVATENYMINRFGPAKLDGYASLENEVETTEIIDDKKISVPKGFYISPFVRVKHIVEEVLAFIGYDLAPSFLDMQPFSGMVFLNDTLDTIVSASIRYIDIIPNITVSALFDILRKFNVEPVPDDRNKTITLVPFYDIIDKSSQSDLSPILHGEPRINYHHDYSQLKLSSERMELPKIVKPLSYTNSAGTFPETEMPPARIPFTEVLAKYPGAAIERKTGRLYAQAFRGERLFRAWIGSLDYDYYAEENLSVTDKKFPDTVPEILTKSITNVGGTTRTYLYPYAGAGRFLQSSINFSDNSVSTETPDKELRPMLCFVYRDAEYRYDVGTLSNYDVRGEKIWDYSLFFNGEDGIFERFWRKYDTLLRNALLKVDFDLLLSEKDKFLLSPLRKVVIHGQEYIISEIKYVPEIRSVETCRLLSLYLQHPISEAKTETEYFVTQPYRWELHSSRNFTIPFNPSGTGTPHIVYKSEPVAIFPPPPTPEQYASGGNFFESAYQVEYGYLNQRDLTFVKQGEGIVTVWLKPVLNT